MTIALTGGSMLSIFMQKMGFTGEVTDIFILRNSIDARTAELFQQRDSSVWLLRPSQKGLLGNPSRSPPHQPAQHPCHPPPPRVLDCSHSAQFQQLSSGRVLHPLKCRAQASSKCCSLQKAITGVLVSSHWGQPYSSDCSWDLENKPHLMVARSSVPFTVGTQHCSLGSQFLSELSPARGCSDTDSVLGGWTDVNFPDINLAINNKSHQVVFPFDLGLPALGKLP